MQVAGLEGKLLTETAAGKQGIASSKKFRQ